MSGLPEITVCARSEFEKSTQRTANPVMPEIKSKNTAAHVKIWQADFLKTGVLWQALISAG
jgi:hypothetical protein